MPRQLTIRNVPDAVAERLERLSRQRDESLNATVVSLLVEAVDYEARRERLARYVTWTPEDVADFDEALRAQRTVDDDLWR